MSAGLRVGWTAWPEWDAWARHSEGCYLLRSNIANWSPDELWRPYTPAHRSSGEPSIRPIWHQHESRVKAHILVCFLAYFLWKTLEQWRRLAGLGHSPCTILEELGRIQSTDVVLPTQDGRQLRLRCLLRTDPIQARLFRSPGTGPP